MPKHFKTLFKTNKIHVHIRKKPEGVYEIRCQINYHCIQASSKNLATAKEKFIEKLHSVDLSIKPEKARKEYFVNYMEEWLATSKKPFVEEATYKDYVHTFSVYIAPHFKGKSFSYINGKISPLVFIHCHTFFLRSITSEFIIIFSIVLPLLYSTVTR